MAGSDDLRLQHAPCVVNTLGQGELCIRGSNMFSGYFLSEDSEGSGFHFDGEWWHTGQVCKFDTKGALYLVGPTHGFIRTCAGRFVNVAVEEAKFAQTCSFVDQIWLTCPDLPSSPKLPASTTIPRNSGSTTRSTQHCSEKHVHVHVHVVSAGHGSRFGKGKGESFILSPPAQLAHDGFSQVTDMCLLY